MVTDGDILSQRLREARLLRGMSIERVADSLDTSATSIWRYEAGQRRPSGPTVHALAALYGRSVAWLIGDKDERVTEHEKSDAVADPELIMSEPLVALRSARPHLTDEDMHDIVIEDPELSLFFRGEWDELTEEEKEFIKGIIRESRELLRKRRERGER